MKLSISNIAWNKENDDEMYSFLSSIGFMGLEIAPTRIWPERPYDQIAQALEYKNRLYNQYGLAVSSMQSIWYGKQECIFGSQEERNSLIEYTKKAFEFSNALGCNNLVFGCPRNRMIPDASKYHIENIAIDFFGRLSEMAIQNGVVLAIEANPTIYNTNYLNYTEEAYDLVKNINQRGLGLNYDLGTVIYNEENVEDIRKYISAVNHIHVSEPRLAVVDFRNIHYKLYNSIKCLGYGNFVSIEMGNTNDINKVKNCCLKFKDIFRG